MQSAKAVSFMDQEKGSGQIGRCLAASLMVPSPLQKRAGQCECDNLEPVQHVMLQLQLCSSSRRQPSELGFSAFSLKSIFGADQNFHLVRRGALKCFHSTG